MRSAPRDPGARARAARAARRRSTGSRCSTAARCSARRSRSRSTGRSRDRRSSDASARGRSTSRSWTAASAQLDFGARGIDEAVRASVHYYNDDDDLDRLVEGVGRWHGQRTEARAHGRRLRRGARVLPRHARPRAARHVGRRGVAAACCSTRAARRSSSSTRARLRWSTRSRSAGASPEPSASRSRWRTRAPPLQRSKAAGAELLGGPVETPWHDVNVRLVAPDGLQLTLFTPAQP